MGRGLARWSVRSWPCLYPGFPRSCPFRPDRNSVSSPRHFKRSMRSSRTTLTAKASSPRAYDSFGLEGDWRGTGRAASSGAPGFSPPVLGPGRLEAIAGAHGLEHRRMVDDAVDHGRGGGRYGSPATWCSANGIRSSATRWPPQRQSRLTLESTEGKRKGGRKNRKK